MNDHSDAPSVLDGHLEPLARRFDVQTSMAISLKRIADALEMLALEAKNARVSKS